MLRAGLLLASMSLALVAASTAGAAEETAPPVRVVRVKAVADEAFRETRGWEDEVRQHVAWSDGKLREMAGIGLELTAIEPWTTHQSGAMTLLLKELEVGVEKDGADAVIGFTGHRPPVTMAFLPGGPVRYPLPFTAGIAFPLGDRVVVRRTDWKKLTRHTLVHEIAHLFGGLHVGENSILETETDRTSFRLDPFNRRILALTRDRDFNQAVRDIPRDELGALVDLYRQAPLRDEKDPDTAIRIAYLDVMAGEIDEALEWFERAMRMAPEQSRDILRFAIVPELEAWAETHEPTIETRYLLARAYFAAERYDEAADQVAPSCSPPSEDAPSCALLGAAHLKAGRLSQAERILRTALERDDSLAEAHDALGSVYAARGRYEEALESYARALELDPDRVDTHFNMGVTSLAAERPGAAEASFREVVRGHPDRDDARAKLALSLARQGEAKASRRVVEPLEERRTLSAFVLRDMAEVYLLDGDGKKAFEHLQLAKMGGIDVSEVEALVQSGSRRERKVGVDELVRQAEAYFRTGRFETARGLLGRAVAERPRDARIPYWLGRVAVGEMDREKARGYFERALELDPKHSPSLYELGWLAYRDEDYAQAVSWLERYVGRERGAGSNPLYMLGRSHYELGNLGEAERHLRGAVRKRSDYGDAFYFLARIFVDSGRDDEARRELKLALGSRSLPEWRREDAHLRLARLERAAGDGDEGERHASVALRLGASETTSGSEDRTLAPDRIEVVRIAPSLTRILPRGREVRVVATVRYDLRSAEQGLVLLIPQDEGGESLVSPQPTAAVSRGAGEITLAAQVTTPRSGAHLEVFLALHGDGARATSTVTRIRFELE